MDCRAGIAVTVTNDGGQPAVVEVHASERGLVATVAVAPGETQVVEIDLDPADQSAAVTVLHGDNVILEEGYDVAVTCGMVTTADCGTDSAAAPAVASNDDGGTGCTSPCWWAPLAGLIGLVIGRRRKDGRLNPYGFAAAGVFGAWFTVTAGISPAVLAAVGAAAAAAAFAVFGKKQVSDEETTDAGDSVEGEEIAATTED